MSRFVAVAVLLLSGAVAHAEPPRLAALGETYAKKHGFVVRVVKSDLGTRQVERHFVPVLPTTSEDFLDTFKRGNGAVTWVSGFDKVHMELSIEPGVGNNYMLARGTAKVTAPRLSQGFLMALAVDGKQVDHWNQFIDRYTPAGQPMYTGRDKYRDPKTNQCHGSCMWWMVHGEVSENLNLAHHMGVRRAKGPEVLGPRLVHAGNENVGPIGIPVNSIAEFDAMSDAQLMGPEPAGGAAEQVKE